MVWSSGGEWMGGLETMAHAELSELPMADQRHGDLRVERTEPPDLGVLSGGETTFRGRQLEELSQIREVEIWSECRRRTTVRVPRQGKLNRLVDPTDLVEIEESREGGLGRVRELKRWSVRR
jgi:hypothetical protein